MDRPHSPTETVRFTLAALLVWVSTLPKDPEGSSHLLLLYTSTYIHFQCASSQPSKQHYSKLSLCCFFCKTLYTGKEQTDVKVSLWLTANSFYFSSLAHSCSVTDSSAFPQTLVSSTDTPAIYFYCENLLVICRSWMHTDTATTWIQVSSQVSDMGLFWKRSSHDICEKFKSLQRFLQWLINFISAKPPSTVFQWHGSFREDFLFSFIFWYLSHQSDIKSCTSFLQTWWRSQEENTNIWTTCEICLGD